MTYPVGTVVPAVWVAVAQVRSCTVLSEVLELGVPMTTLLPEMLESLVPFKSVVLSKT